MLQQVSVLVTLSYTYFPSVFPSVFGALSILSTALHVGHAVTKVAVKANEQERVRQAVRDGRVVLVKRPGRPDVSIYIDCQMVL